MVTGCGASGDSVASDTVGDVADQLATALDTHSSFSETAAGLVMVAISNVTGDYPPNANEPTRVVIDPLVWKGTTISPGGAQIEVRIRVDVSAHQSTGFGDTAREAGSAIDCYRYVIGGTVFTARSRHHISCPDGPAPSPPRPEPVHRLPADAADVLKRVVARTVPGQLAGDVRAAFPQTYITVDTVTVDGKTIAAVGVPRVTQCIVAVRNAKGVKMYEGFDREWLAPGETGCSTQLITNPPR